MTRCVWQRGVYARVCVRLCQFEHAPLTCHEFNPQPPSLSVCLPVLKPDALISEEGKLSECAVEGENVPHVKVHARITLLE